MTYCATCDHLDVEHEIRADGSRGKRFGAGQVVKSVSSPGVACPGFVPGRAEDRPPEDELRRRLAAELAFEDELRRRLAAVLALHQPHPGGVPRPWCTECAARVRTGRYETLPGPAWVREQELDVARITNGVRS